MKLDWKHGDSSPERVDDDVVVVILSFCEVQTIISFSQASKHTHGLVFSSREIWLSAAHQLHSLGYLDVAPEQQLSRLSLNELLFLIKRIAISSNGGQTQVLPPQTISLSILDNDPPFGHPDALVINGGEYILLAERSVPGAQLSCWSMKTRSAVWSSRDEQPSLIGDAVKIVKFAAQVDDSKRLDILICLRDPDMPPPNDFEATYKVQLWRISLAHKAVEVVDLLEYGPDPGSPLWANEFECEADCKLCLCDDYAVAYGINQLIIHNQSSKQTMRFHTDAGHGTEGDEWADEMEDDEWGDEDRAGETIDDVTSVQRLRGLLFLGLQKANQGPFRTLIWDLRAVATQQNSQDSMLIDDVQSIHRFDTGTGETFPQLACYSSPYTDDVLYLDLLIARYSSPQTQEIQRYRVSLLQQSKLLVEKVGSLGPFPRIDMVEQPGINSFSPAERSFSCVKNGTCIDDFPSLKGDVVMEGANIACRSPYSRTVVYVKERKVFLIYYG